MRPRFSEYEPASGELKLAAAGTVRADISDPSGQDWYARAGSVVLHVAVVCLILFLPHGPPPGDEEAAPTFAVQFDTGAAADQPPTTSTAPSASASAPAAASQPRISLDGDDGSPEPPPQPTPQPEPETVLPPLHYGAALQPHNSNPFAHIVPFSLSQSRPTSPTALPPGSRGLDLAAGPVVRDGRLMDSVQHVVGRHGYQDYDEEIRAFADAHKYYPREAAENGEQGAATLQITIARDGTVKHLVWVGHSGSALLDAAWYSVFADNKLPPMNDDMPGDEYTFTFTLDYYLMYGHQH